MHDIKFLPLRGAFTFTFFNFGYTITVGTLIHFCLFRYAESTLVKVRRACPTVPIAVDTLFLLLDYVSTSKMRYNGCLPATVADQSRSVGDVANDLLYVYM